MAGCVSSRTGEYSNFPRTSTHFSVKFKNNFDRWRIGGKIFENGKKIGKKVFEDSKKSFEKIKKIIYLLVAVSTGRRR